ncbi:MCE family protein [Mycobacterium eburneum]|nr:MlaD family protein [Mycobacterium eburneum]TDH50297.1 MCE family protein [Mycobacterium eburneum]
MTFRRRPRRDRQAVLDEHAAAARNRRHGIVALVVIVAALAATGLAYLNPTGKTTYTAHLSTAGGVRPGDEVRIAGINVGAVTGIRLRGTEVEMTFDVQHSVAVGSQSTLEVKMLTPLGGHYVALDPKGEIPLGRTVLPAQNTTTPFEISDIIQTATPLVKEVNGQVIHDTFSEVANAANRYPDALRDVLTSAHALTESLSTMTTDFHKGLNFAGNGISAMVAGRKQIVALTEQLALLGRTYTAKSVDIVEYFTALDELARMIDRFMVFYGREVAPIVNGIDDIIDTLVAHPDRLGQAAISLGQALEIVWPMLSGNGITIDEGHFLVPGQDLCLPHIMRQC